MRKFSLVLAAAVMAVGLAVSGNASAQGSATDQYKQMGGLVALEYLCFDEYQLYTSLGSRVLTTIFTNPDLASMQGELIKHFNIGYEKAFSDQVLWVGMYQNFSLSSFDCSNSEDTEIIRKMVDDMVKALDSGQTVGD